MLHFTGYSISRSSLYNRDDFYIHLTVRHLCPGCWSMRSHGLYRFIAFGVALDPRQQQLFGMFAGPLAVGCALGVVSFASAGLVPGYDGASMNPARCFAFAVGRRTFPGTLVQLHNVVRASLTLPASDHWIWWVGPMSGTIIHTVVFWIAPPYHSSPVPSHR